MSKHHALRYVILGLGLMVAVWSTPAGAETIAGSDVIMRALNDELVRSMTLQMEDLEKPYFIQFTVEDTVAYRIAANYGDLTSSDRDRSRDFYSRVRVGSYELDNTNFSGDSGYRGLFGGGGDGGARASLPLEDDYEALRQAIWWAVDGDYKDAVETLTKKRAYMKDKNLQDRPPDYTKGTQVEHLDPPAQLEFDRTGWEEKVKQVSARFNKYPQVQDSQVQLYVAAGNTYVVNTEGTRLRTSDSGGLLIINAELQAEDGMRLSDSRTYYAPEANKLPAVDDLLADVDKLVAGLTKLTQAPVLERYTGPVLFDGVASAQVFRGLLAEGLAAREEPVGSQRRDLTGAGSLEKKLEQRILPDSFKLYDDPTGATFAGTDLLGHYLYDDEGEPAVRVDLVEEGTLKNMVLSRAPTKKLSGSNGHARRAAGGGEPESAIGCLYVKDEEGIPATELKARLLEAAEDEGLEFALRVESIRTTGLGSSASDFISSILRMQQRGGQAGLGDPVYAYKVYVEDGREELVRGCEFGSVKLRDLKQIAAAGDTPTVYNYVGMGFAGSTPSTSIIAPPVLIEELELSKIEQEYEKLPVLKNPLTR